MLRSLGRLLWSPVRASENWAQTLVRVVGNLLRWIIGLPLLIGLAAWGASSIDSWMSDRPRHISELEGIDIGMTPTEVTLVKGAPSTDGPMKADDNSWKQAMVFDDLLVLFKGSSEEALRVSRVCLTAPRAYQEVIGVGGADSEKDVVRHLGQPDSEKIDADGLGKQSYFDQYNLMLRFEKAQVSGICVGT